MKLLSLLLVTSLLAGCTSQKKATQKIMNSWLGGTKQNLILQWGPPTQVTSDGNNGEILIYAKRTYFVLNAQPVDYWEYRMMYVNTEGKIYHWLFRRNPNPPDRLDVRLLL